jgi:hypothetical protein
MFNMLWQLSGIVTRLVVMCLWVRIHCGAVFVVVIIIIIILTVTKVIDVITTIIIIIVISFC